jgi:uncharacterized repeat protein (TIGR01451 family)
MMTRVDAMTMARRNSRLAGWLTCALALAGALLVPGGALAAGAATANTILIDAIGNNGAVRDRTEALALGFDVEYVTDAATWNAKTTADFRTYKAIALPDNYCGGPSATAIANRTTWAPAVTGNIIIVGGDPELHSSNGNGAATLVRNGIGFAANNTGKTGLWVALGCSAITTPIDQFGTFVANGMSTDTVHIVAVHPALTGLNDTNLSNWGTSTHLSFASKPADFIPLAIQQNPAWPTINSSTPGYTCYADSTCGPAFLLVRGDGVQPVGLNLGASGPASVAAGTAFTYTLTYGNTGGTNATGVVITAPVPSGATFGSATGGGTLAGSTVTWNIGALAKATSGLTVSYTVTASSGGTVTMSGAQITDSTNTTTAADVTTTVTAPPTGITVSSGTVAYGYPGDAVVVDSGVLVEAPSNLDNATVSIGTGFMAGQDLLSFTASGGITGSYNSTTGVLTLSGNASAAAYQAVLRTVTYNNTGSGATSGTRTVAFSLGSGLNYSGTGHFYEFVANSGITWDNAATAAAARTYFGLRGYLVTVTSAGENAFVKAKLAQNAWMGLSTDDADFPRTWKWATGPEAGTSICDNASAGSCTAIGAAYTNWDSGEPNNAGGESKGHFYADDGKWNDFSPTNGSIGGYVVEYGGTSGDPSVVLSGSRGVVVSISIPTSTTVASSAPGAVWGQPVTFTATISPTAGGTVQFKIDGTNFGSPVSVSGGAATSGATSGLSVADHAISAVYSGDATHIASSGSTTQRVAKAATTVGIVSSAAITIYRSSVTLAATVAVTWPGGGTPAGTVAFDVDGVAISGCTAQAVSGGTTATCVTSDLPVGYDAVHATYSGDTSFVGSGPASTEVLVNRATPSVGIASSANPSVFGDSVTFTATASGVGVTPTGAVVFREGETTFCSTTLSAGVATCTVALLSTPSHTITVAYAGDGNYLPLSPTIAQTVNKAPTSTALAAAPTPSTYGQVVTLTATVTGPAITPSGTIAFTDGGTALTGCSARAMSAGVATCVLPNTLVGGSHAFAAAYSGDSSFLASSGSASLTVNKATPTLALATSKSLSTYGEPVTFTVTASYGVGVPTGLVSVMDGATLICGPVTLVAGSASCGSRVVTVGTHALTATSVGDGNFLGATSPPLTQLQVRGTTTSDVVANMNQSVYGQPVTLTATVYPDSPSVEIPTGTITFRDSSSPICTNVPVDAAGVATCITSSLTVGVHALSGRYNGSTGYSPSTSFSYAVKVNQASTQVALAASPVSSVFGQPVTFTITVPAVAPGAGVATGTVSLTDGGSAVAGCTNLALTGASASCTTATFAVGSHALGISYSGDGNFLASTASPSFTVNKAATSTAVVTSQNPSRFGQGVTFTATVAVSTPGAGTPSGTVSFRADGAAIGTGTIAGGVASFTTSSLAVPSHAITAVYSGDGSFLTSTSSTLTQVVNKAWVSVALSPLTSTVFGQSVSFSVSVTAISPGAGTPSGTVVLTDGATTIATLTLSGGAASMSTSTLVVGNHSINASYQGDSSFLTGSAGATQVVNRANTATVLVSTVPTSKFGQAVTLTATVGSVSPGAGVPAGTVTIREGGTLLCGPLTLSGGSASCTTAALGVGPHPLTATYSGSTSQLVGTPGLLTQTVVRADTTLVMDEPPPTSLYGEPIVLTTYVAAKAPGAGLPAGTVEFYDNETLLGSAEVDQVTGAATFTVLSSAPLSVGSHAFLATYGGDGDFTGSVTELSIAHTVDPGSVLVALALSPASAVWGQSVEVQVVISAIAPAEGVPGGTVEIVEGGVVIQTLTLDAAGTTSWTTSAFTVATHELTARYLGVTEWLPETSPAASLVVEKAATATALAISPSATVFGQSLTLTATITVSDPGAGSPAGTVTFRDGETVLGTGAVDPATGLATFSTAGLAVGIHSLGASYEGDDHFTTSLSESTTLEVTKASVEVALASSVTPSVFGQSVSFSVAVTAVSPGAGTPSGTVVLRDNGTTIATLTLSGGSVSGTTSTLEVNSHAISASYLGDSSFLAGSAGATQVVDKANTATVLVSSVPTSRFGQPVVLTVAVGSVAPGAGVPTGTVTIDEGNTRLCMGPMTLVNGAVSCITGALAVGSHALTATYSGSASQLAGTPGLLTQTVVRADTTLVMDDPPPTSLYGEPIVLTTHVAPVAPGAGLPAGTVEFYDNETLLGSAPVDPLTGVATFTVLSSAPLSVGSHAFLATYGGDGSFTGSVTELSIAHTVDPGSVLVALSYSPASAVWGQPVEVQVSLSAVAPAVGIPGGTVEIYEGGVVIQTLTLDAAGTASWTTSAFTVATHELTASYLGVTEWLPETSPAASLVVEKAATATALAISPSATVFGQSLTLTATVTVTAPGAGSPAGTVTFRDGETVLGTGAVDPATGLATFSTADLAVGSHGLGASYEGDEHFTTSLSEPAAFDVTRASVRVTLNGSVTPSVSGQPVTFSVTVAAVSPGAGTPSGTVVLTDNGTTIATLTLSGGSVSGTTDALSVGIHVISASYAGDGSFKPGSAGATQLVGQAQSATELSVTPAPSLAGQTVTLTARVSAQAPSGSVPTGTVQFREGATLLGTGTLDGSGVANVTATLRLAGSHTIEAVYGGSEEHATSSATLIQVVGRVTPALALSSSPSPSMYGQVVTLAVVVSARAPGAGSPTGTVTFLDGGTVLGSGQLDLSGRATFSLASLSSGDHAITAAYAGDANFLAGTTATALRQTVAQGTASVSVTSSRNPSRHGRPVVLTATVSSPHAVPTGAVTFKDGDTVLGTGTLQDGVAHLTDRSLVKGTHAITVDYAGVDDFAAGQGTLEGGQIVENTPPVAGSGSSIAFGPAGAASVTIADALGALAPATGTVELWVKPAWAAAGDVGGTPSILRFGPTDAPAYALGVSADRQRLVVTSSAGATGYPAPLDDGGWHHVALKSGDGTVKALVDGIEVASFTGSFATASGSLVIGEGFLGELDELRVWSTTRNSTELAANRRRPLQGDESGLIGYWRLDEEAGVELFDASPSHFDGAVTLASGAAGAFVPSAAWRHRVGQQERPLPAIDAGYDVDGDPLTLAMVTAPGHGTATFGHAALQVNYVPGATFLGDDTFTYSLTDDGGLTSSYTIDVTVERILLCQASADCSGGDLCVQGICTAGPDVTGRSGSSGCSTGSGSGSILWVALILGLLTWRPSRTRPGAGRFLAALLLAGGAVTAQAQVTPPPSLPAGFAAQLFEPAPAGDRFFTMAGASAPGHLAPAAGLVLSWANDPLVLYQGNTPVPGGRMVKQQVWGWAVGSLGLGDRALVDVALPVVLHQSGSQPFTDLSRVSASGLGDLRLGGRYLITSGAPFDLAVGLSIWLPTGAKEAFASDGGVRVEPKLIGSFRDGPMEYGAELGVLYREQKEIVITELGTALSFAAGAAYRWDSFRIGPELYGHYQFKGTTTSPAELLLGGRYEHGDFDYGLGAATQLNRAPGASPFRLVVQVGWSPGTGPAARLAARQAADQRARERQAAQAAAEAAAEEAALAVARAAVEAQLAADTAAAAKAKAEAERRAAEQPVVAAAPAPAPALVNLTAERIEILQSIQFETGQEVIRPESEPLLREVAALILAHPELDRIRVEGHTDSLGPADLNTRLSGQRAGSVVRWLVEKGGVEGSRLSAEGFGPSRPVASNDTREGRARNRRVEFKLVAAP